MCFGIFIVCMYVCVYYLCNLIYLELSCIVWFIGPYALDYPSGTNAVILIELLKFIASLVPGPTWRIFWRVRAPGQYSARRDDVIKIEFAFCRPRAVKLCTTAKTDAVTADTSKHRAGLFLEATRMKMLEAPAPWLCLCLFVAVFRLGTAAEVSVWNVDINSVSVTFVDIRFLTCISQSIMSDVP